MIHLKIFQRTFLLLTLIFVFFGCNSDSKKKTETKVEQKTEAYKQQSPLFNADSAYSFVKAQCEFGPRVPNTKKHDDCAAYLTQFMRKYSNNVLTQQAKVKAYNGTMLNITNIIAQFNPEIKQRIMFFAHWDTRPWADQDMERPDEPILGADDGASGVGVLMEMARILSANKISVGVDIMFFDAEDYGTKMGDNPIEDSYALGTQYWCKNRVPSGYTAQYGILLDMVGAYNATFLQEGYSVEYANELVQKVWTLGGKLGYEKYFVWQVGPVIDDDHKYPNQLLNIPSIDIIHLNMHGGGKTFAPHWHTHQDNMDVIDKNTLKAVGQTLLETLWSMKAN